MCDQTEVKYVPGDIVWVKLSNVWWPAEVQDLTKLDEEVTAGLKRPPLAVVRFFGEDSYEYPKHLNQIYHYNCTRKDEFIKKGLDLYSTESKRDSYMKKFPEDVRTAELKTGGNPDYINDFRFLAEDREKIGSKPLKKIYSHRTECLSKPPSNLKASPKVTVTFGISPSNSGASEFKSPVQKKSDSLQKKIKTSSGVPVLKSPKSSKKTPLSYFPCRFCAVSCDRVESIIAHMKFHLKGILPPAPSGFPNQFEISERNLMGTCSNSTLTPGYSDKNSAKKRRSAVPIVSDVPQMEKVDIVNEDNKFVVSPPHAVQPNSVNSSTPKKLPRAKKQTVVKENNGQKAALESLLLDWEEDPTVDENVESSPEKDIRTTKNIDSDKTIVHESLNSPNKPENCSLSLISCSENKSLEKSCFDFEDTEDELNLDQSLKFGQKLPRVINDKQSSMCRIKQDLKTEDAQDVLSKDVDNFLDSVEMPNIPEIPSSIHVSTTLPVKEDEFCESSDDVEKIEIVKDSLLSDNLIISPTKEPQGTPKSGSISPLTIFPNLKPSSSGNDEASSNNKNSATCDVSSLSGKSDKDFSNINLTENQLMLKKPCNVSDPYKPCSVSDKSNEFQKEDIQTIVCTDNIMPQEADVLLKLPLTCVKTVEIGENNSVNINNNTTNKVTTEKDNVDCKLDSFNVEMLKNVDDILVSCSEDKNEDNDLFNEDILRVSKEPTHSQLTGTIIKSELGVHREEEEYKERISENKNEEIQKEPIIEETDITALMPTFLSESEILNENNLITSENSEMLNEKISSSSLSKPAESDSVKKIPLNVKNLKITSKEENENKTNVLGLSQTLSSISKNNDDQENESVMKADKIPNQSLTDDLSCHLNSLKKPKKSDLIQENFNVQSLTKSETNLSKDNSKLFKHNSNTSIANKDILPETKDSVDGTASSFKKSCHLEKTENLKRRKTEKFNFSAENDLIDNSKKKIKLISSPVMQEKEMEDKQIKSNLYTPGITDVSEIPLSQNIYSKHTELPKDLKKGEKEKSYPVVSDQPLDINSMPVIIADDIPDDIPDMEIFCGWNMKPPQELLDKATRIISLNFVRKGEERVTPGKKHLFNITLPPNPPPDFVPACPDATILNLINRGNQPSTSTSRRVSAEEPSASCSRPRKVKSSEIKSHIPNTVITNISSSGKHPVSSKQNVEVVPERQKVFLASSSAGGPHQQPGPSIPGPSSTLYQSKSRPGPKKMVIIKPSQNSGKPIASGKTCTVPMPIPIYEKNIPKINNRTTPQPNTKTIPLKIKQSPHILQRSSHKVVRQVVANKALNPPVRTVQSIVSNESSGNVVYLTVADNDSTPINSIIPIQCNTGNRNLNNIISMDPNGYVNMENANVSRKQTSETDILAKALEDTQVLLPDSPDFSLYQQFPISLTSNVSETSSTLNQPIMSPVEVPSSVDTQKCTPVLKRRINPSMPPLDDISIGTTSQTIEFVHEGNILLDSSENPSIPGSPMFSTSFLTFQEQPLTADVSLPSGFNSEANVLPEFLRGEFDKKSQKSHFLSK